MVDRSASIYVAGHRGMVGSALVRCLRAQGYARIVTRTRAELDLTDSRAVHAFLVQARPDYIFVAAAKVGGIQANDRFRADFLYQNLMIEANLIHGAHLAGVQRLMFLASSCIHPRDCAQPIKEEYLLTGLLERTNEPYAIAKIAGVKLAETHMQQYGRQYVSVMPTNLYGPNDNYDLAASHVVPALVRKAHDAKVAHHADLVVWGSGTPRREFLYVDDLAQACVHLMSRDCDGPPLNVGCGEDVSIAEFAETVRDLVGGTGRIVFDAGKPDGTPRKLLDVSRLFALGWRPCTPLREGIALAYASAPFRH